MAPSTQVAFTEPNPNLPIIAPSIGANNLLFFFSVRPCRVASAGGLPFFLGVTFLHIIHWVHAMGDAFCFPLVHTMGGDWEMTRTRCRGGLSVTRWWKQRSGQAPSPSTVTSASLPGDVLKTSALLAVSCATAPRHGPPAPLHRGDDGLRGGTTS